MTATPTPATPLPTSHILAPTTPLSIAAQLLPTTLFPLFAIPHTTSITATTTSIPITSTSTRSTPTRTPTRSPIGSPIGSTDDTTTTFSCLLESDLRAAIQSIPHDHTIQTIDSLARTDLLATDEQAAQALLLQDPHLPGTLVRGSPLRVLVRSTKAVTTAVVMAGGLGKRLRPLTENVPKPLLDVRGEPLLVRILKLLHQHGVRRVFLSVHYLAHMIKARIGDGSTLGVEVQYLEEDSPLDTGAGLVLMPRIEEPFFVMNGDLVTTVNLSSMARHHMLSGALATVGTYLFPAPLPYGLVERELESDAERITRIDEKPVIRYPINAGIYVFAPEVLERVPHGAPLPMVPFLNERAAAGERIVRFPIVEYWNDVGAHVDYQRAQEVDL